jgi:hypothetical protein
MMATNKITLKQANRRRYFSFWTAFVARIAIPLVVTSTVYDLWRTSSDPIGWFEITGIGMIVGIIVAFGSMSYAKREIAKMENDQKRLFAEEFVNAVPYGVILFVSYAVETHARNFQMIAWSLIIGQGLGYYFKVNHLKYKELAKEIKLKETYKEAQREL